MSAYINTDKLVKGLLKNKIKILAGVIVGGILSYGLSAYVVPEKYDIAMMVEMDYKNEYVQPEWDEWAYKVFKEDIAQRGAEYVERKEFINEVLLNVDKSKTYEDVKSSISAYKIDNTSNFKINMLTSDKYFGMQVMSEILYKLENQVGTFDDVESIEIADAIVVTPQSTPLWDSIVVMALGMCLVFLILIAKQILHIPKLKE